MIIDFHTHCWPEKIANKAVEKLAEISGFKPVHNGTVEELSDITKRAGYSYSIAMPVVTKPGSSKTINQFAKSITRGNIVSFGALHPEEEDFKDVLDNIKELGIPGVKMHPDYQGFYIEEDRIKEIADYAGFCGLPIMFHAGFDPLSPEDIHCKPKGARELIDDVPNAKIIFAHMGGEFLWDEVIEYLMGQNCYIDTSMCLKRMPDGQFERIVMGHNPSKILYGTDSPWGDPFLNLELFMGLEIPGRVKEMILSENARDLLKNI